MVARRASSTSSRSLRCGPGDAGPRRPPPGPRRVASAASSMTSVSARPVKRRCSPPTTAQIRPRSEESNSSAPASCSMTAAPLSPILAFGGNDDVRAQPGGDADPAE